jgi:hypothetical protein
LLSISLLRLDGAELLDDIQFISFNVALPADSSNDCGLIYNIMIDLIWAVGRPVAKKKSQFSMCVLLCYILHLSSRKVTPMVQNHSIVSISSSQNNGKSAPLRVERLGSVSSVHMRRHSPIVAAKQQALDDVFGTLSNDSSCVGLALPSLPAHHFSDDVQERRLRALESHVQGLLLSTAEGGAQILRAKGDKKSSKSKKQAPSKRTSVFQIARYCLTALLLGITAYVSYQLGTQWVDVGSLPSTSYSLDTVGSLAMPTAGMIPAPYATDARCFQPTPTRCSAYKGEALAMDCMSWLTVVSTSQRPGGEPMIIWALDGVKASKQGYTFQSILDYVEYTFSFPDDCTEPYLWVYVSGDTKIVTEAKMEPSLSMRAYAQSSFLVQGGQYVMVAFSMLQDVDLDGVVTNTSAISASSMMTSAFNASLSKQATAVFRPASFKIQTTTQLPGQTFFEFLASVGGWVGLFLGFSVIQVIEFVELLVELWNKRRQADVKDEGEKDPSEVSSSEDL